MASLRVHPDRLEIQLTPAEKALALRRDEISVPRSAIRSVTITDDPWIWIRGIRAPGSLVPLVLAVGTWKFHGGKDFLVIKNKRQAVIIDIADGEYARHIVSTNHAAELVRALNVSPGDAETAALAAAAAQAAAGAGAEGAAPTKDPKARAVRLPRLARAAKTKAPDAQGTAAQSADAQGTAAQSADDASSEPASSAVADADAKSAVADGTENA
ncbi:hypothetical protein [Microterricola viridarii]|uniref:Uncharacterized protein n=1 Tax=Microterricola viridarii TaxID=412690 RepID=A0A1H1LNK5_9MICO|nr:hypothetical protein [Microterricola viridarii]SDR76116.1 hypothetical protein SAMN04489834_0165 [Microterricola viridarii]